MNSPGDVRNLIKSWLRDVSETGTRPFETGGVVVQLLNTWLKSWELDKISDIEMRLTDLEHKIEK